MHRRDYDVAFIGGGLSSALAALCLRAREPALRVAVVEREARLGGDHTWCFHAADVPADAAPRIEPLIVQRWPGYEVRFPERRRRLASPYACIQSARLHEVVTRSFEDAPGSALHLGVAARALSAHEVALENGCTLTARLVVSAPGPAAQGGRGLASGYQKFVGLELEVEPGHALSEPILIDACIAQRDGFRFMYVLPLAPTRVLVEETFFSEGDALHEAESTSAILDYARSLRLSVRGVARVERGVLPMPWQGDAPFDAGARPLRAGYGGGLFHPVTGYSFPLALRFAQALAASDLERLEHAPDDPRSPLAAFARAHAAQRPFLRLLTRLMFTAFAPEERYAVLSHFYRLPEPLIERFYAADLRVLDRARIFWGAPPPGFSARRALGLGPQDWLGVSA